MEFLLEFYEDKKIKNQKIILVDKTSFLRPSHTFPRMSCFLVSQEV